MKWSNTQHIIITSVCSNRWRHAAVHYLEHQCFRHWQKPDSEENGDPTMFSYFWLIRSRELACHCRHRMLKWMLQRLWLPPRPSPTGRFLPGSKPPVPIPVCHLEHFTVYGVVAVCKVIGGAMRRHRALVGLKYWYVSVSASSLNLRTLSVWSPPRQSFCEQM